MPVDLESANYSYDADGFGAIVDSMRESIGYFHPELILIGTICALFLATLVVDKKGQRHLAWLAVAGLVASLVALLRIGGAEPTLLFQGMIAHDSYATFFKVIFLVSTLAVVFMSLDDRGLDGLPMGEYYGLILSSVLGMFLLASATDLLMIFLALEMVSIPTYILVVFRKARRDSTEAALKYVVYGSVSGAIMVYGLSVLYGLTGSTSLDSLTTLQAGGVDPAVLIIVGLMVFAGFAYKVAAVPMHFWAPDIYQGAPTSITAFLSVGSKAAGFAGLVRFLYAMNMGEGLVAADQIQAHLDWATLLAVVSAVTMTLGNLGALFQTNVKRMLAYSSIAHAGYLLMGVAALSGEGYASVGSVGAPGAVAYYFLAFLFMNLGAFTVIILVAGTQERESIDDYRGLGRRAPVMAFCLTVCLVSLIGIPPTAGFVAKFLLIKVAIEKSLFWLAIVAGVNTAISAYYYLRIVKNLYLEKSDAYDASTDREPALEMPALGQATALALTVGVLLFGTLFGSAASWVSGIEIHNSDPAPETTDVALGKGAN